MPIKVKLKDGELRIAQMQFDFMKQPMEVNVLACLTDPEVGSTIAWLPAGGVVWSTETNMALRKLVQCLERDIASVSMAKSTSASAGAAEDDDVPTLGGIGERIRSGAADAPQM